MPELTSLIGNADAFPVLRRWTYFNHAGVSPLPKVVGDAMRAFVDAAEAGAYLDVDWWGQMDRVRRAAATFVNADPGEVALVKNTSEGISTVALGLDLKPGDRVVTAAVEYSANVYPWMAACRRAGAELVFVAEETDAAGRRAVPTEKLLAAADHPNTKVVTVSHVQYGSGQRTDVTALGAFCRPRGIFLNVDAIQSLGALPVDVAAMQIDALSACGHKWLFGPPGAGIMYVRKAWRDRVKPLLVGHTSMVGWEAFSTNYSYTLRPDAGRYESGTVNLPGTFGLGAALEMLNAVGINAIAERIKRLTDRLVEGLQAKGWSVVSPRGGEAWSGIVACTSPAHDHDQLVVRLRKEQQIELCVREGRLRLSPHFYNTDEQVERVLDAVPSH